MSKMSPTRALKSELLTSSYRAQTFQELIHAVANDPTLPSSRRHNVVSALRRFCVIFSINPLTTTATRDVVRRHLEGFEPQRAGIKRKRFQNITSDINFAFDRNVWRAPRGRDGLTPEWLALRELLRTTELKIALPSFLRFCSDRSIHPGMVCDTVAQDYGRWLCDETLRQQPKRRWRSAMKAWNKASQSITGWPNIILSVPSFRKSYCLPWKAFQISFIEDAEAYLNHLVTRSPFKLDAPKKLARPKSVQSYRFGILQIASALVISGKPIEEILHLSDLVIDQNAEAALRFFYEKTPKQAANLAHLLLKIARYWCKLKEPELEHLKIFKQNLAPPKRSGMTAKNRDRLRPFVDIENIEAILLLPQGVYERVARVNKPTGRNLVELQIALALELLLMAPIRRANLVALRIGPKGHIRRNQDRIGTTHIVVPGEEVKNGEELDFPLPAVTSALLDVYLLKYRPLLVHADTDWLFPGEDNVRHKSLDHFSRQFTKTIRRLTGLTVNLHLMRHFAAKLYLDRNPGSYEVMRRVLVHRAMSTTANTYAGTETEAAVRHFDSVILGIRDRKLQDASHG